MRKLDTPYVKINETVEGRVNWIRVYRAVQGSECTERTISLKVFLPTYEIRATLDLLCQCGHVYGFYHQGKKLYHKVKPNRSENKVLRSANAFVPA